MISTPFRGKMARMHLFVSALCVLVCNIVFQFVPLSDFTRPEFAYAAAISWDGGGDGSTWEDGDNWSGNVQPGVDDDVTIDANATVNINAATTINSLTLGNAGGTTTPTLNFAYDASGASNNLDIDDGDLTVYSGATITHTLGTTAVVGRVDIDVQTGSATITGSINANEKGYAQSEGAGAGTDSSGGCGGGSYGGVGGTGQDDEDGVPGEVYGSISNPTDIGSGGGLCFTSAGKGGGAVKLTVAATLTVNGSITANGQSISSTQSGGGSGGSVWLDASTVAGSGTVTANGGQGDSSGHAGAGGGGRIAVFYDTLSLSNTNIRAYGGAGESALSIGGAGTVYLKDNAADPDLIIDNNNVEGGFGTNDDRFIGRTKLTPTSTPLSLALNELIIRNDGNLNLTSDTTLTYATLTWNDDGIITDNGGTLALIDVGATVIIPQGAKLYANTTKTWADLTVSGVLTHSNSNQTADGQRYQINITSSSDIDITATGKIDASYRGWSEDQGTGKGTTFATGAGGGSHGGVGGTGADNRAGAAGDVYGSITAPVTIGSGGGTQVGSVINGGASGGGAIRLTAASGTITVNGSITADGESASTATYGAGSGGSIYLSASTIDGSSIITANGGDGGSNTAHPGSGGGGRIAIFYDTLSVNDTNIRAYGGQHASVTEATAGAGTVYLKDSAVSNGDLIIDNNDQEEALSQEDRWVGKTKLTPTSTPLSLTLDELVIRNAGHLDLTSDTTLTYSTLTWSDAGRISDNGGSLAAINTGATVTIPATAMLYANTTKTWADLTVNGVLTHSNNYLEADGEEYKINITSSADVDVTATGSIYVDGRGYGGDQGPGNGVTNSGGAGGGSYGGVGGTGDNDYGGTPGEVYGSISAPVNIGSGGGTQNNNDVLDSGRGGGAIRLTASSGTVTINGSVSANGTSTDTSSSGGGSGGSVYITAATVEGSSTISANGGAGDDISGQHAGSGGGGRIAIIYDALTLANTSINAYGGINVAAPESHGGAGTIYLKDNAATYPDLIIDNNDTDINDSNDRFIGRTKLTPTSTALSLTVDELVLRNGGNLNLTSDTTLTYATLSWTDGFFTDNGGTAGVGLTSGSITVPTGARWIANTARTYSAVELNGKLSHTGNNSLETYKIDLATTGDFSVNSGASVDLNGLGYMSPNGPGAGEDSGNWGSGAGHGGAGGVSSDGGSVAGGTYDSETEPENLGSGGGNDGAALGGAGGGAIKLTVGGNLVLEESITTDAFDALGEDAGGGSGGAIWIIITGQLSGDGNLTAEGGDGQEVDAGAGGGGRIRLECLAHQWTGSFSVVAGSLGNAATSGTVSTDCIADVVPTIANVTAAQVLDGSGYVVITFDADDVDGDDTLEALVEYDVGGGFTKATISTIDGDTTADFGDPDVNNADTYPIGESGGFILTSSGANTVSTVWLAGTDEDGVDVSDAQIRVTLYDGVLATSPATSSTFNLDLDVPSVTGASYLDTNSDGTVDRVDVVFDEAMLLSAYDDSDWGFTQAGSVNLNDTSASVSTNTVRVGVSADADETGGATSPTLVYSNNANRLTDAAGNPAATFGSALTVTDAAPPLILSTDPENNGEISGSDDVVINFTEAMDTGSVSYTFSKTPTGITDTWSNGDTTFTISHTGTFSSGTLTFRITAADASAGSPVALAGAISPSANPMTFNVSIEGGMLAINVSNEALLIEESCSPSSLVNVILKASRAVEVMLSEDPLFRNAAWQPFQGFVINEEIGVDELGIYTDFRSWDFKNDGERTLYAQFRSETRNLSTVVLDRVTVDKEGMCGEKTEEEVEEVVVPDEESGPNQEQIEQSPDSSTSEEDDQEVVDVPNSDGDDSEELEPSEDKDQTPQPERIIEELRSSAAQEENVDQVDEIIAAMTPTPAFAAEVSSSTVQTTEPKKVAIEPANKVEAEIEANFVAEDEALEGRSEEVVMQPEKIDESFFQKIKSFLRKLITFMF